MLYPAVLLYGGFRAVPGSAEPSRVARAFSVPFSRARHGVTCKCKCEHLNEATRHERPAKAEHCLRREGRRDSAADKIKS